MWLRSNQSQCLSEKMAEAAYSPRSSAAKTEEQGITFQRKPSITPPLSITEVVEKYRFLGVKKKLCYKLHLHLKVPTTPQEATAVSFSPVRVIKSNNATRACASGRQKSGSRVCRDVNHQVSLRSCKLRI